MIINACRTIYEAMISNYNKFKEPYTPLSNTTLNEKFEIYSDYEFSEIPTMQLHIYHIGVGGSKIIDSTALDMNRGSHEATDASLFKPVPFRIRETVNDLTASERELYRLRKLVTIEGNDYYCYYGKVIDSYEYKPDIYKITNIQETPNISVLSTLTIDPLNPVPISNTEMSTLNNSTYVITYLKLLFKLTAAELNEIQTAIDMLYPDDQVSNITEIAICTGEDIDVSYGKESVWCQIMYHIDVDFDKQVLYNLSDGSLQSYIELTGMEPLYRTSE